MGDIEARIKTLNTPEYSSVFLKASNGNLLTVVGVAGRGMLVFMSGAQGHHYVLAPLGNRKGKVTIVIGFQPGEYPNRILVDLGTALKVAHSFFLTGQRDQSVECTQDDATIE